MTDAQRRLAALATLDDIVATVAARNHRGVAMGVVASAVRARTGVDLGDWAMRLAYPAWTDLVRALPCVHALVAHGADWHLLPAALQHLPGDEGRWNRAPPSPEPVVPTPVVVRTARQCHKAVADLRRFAFVSLVVDASPCHDLGMVYVGARESGDQRAVCYAFDVHATAPGTGWHDAAQIFGTGGLAWFLGDPAVPKAVCGVGPGHDSGAHIAAKDLARSVRTPVAGCNGSTATGLLVRGIVRVLPLEATPGSAAADALHGLGGHAWAQAAAAPNGDRWHWLRRPLSSHVLANGAERAIALCAAYEAAQKAGASSRPTRPSATGRPAPLVPITDSLLCIAAAQTAACAAWPVSVGLGHDRRPNRDGSHLAVVAALDGARGRPAVGHDEKDRAVAHHALKAGPIDVDDADGDWDDLWRAVQQHMAVSAAADSYAAAATGAPPRYERPCAPIGDDQHTDDQHVDDQHADGVCGFHQALLPSPLWAYSAP
ncbi:hypothetical protein pdul_cds_800 [Pandoravirus dulcis]|uniref:Uncharacterized protein n=1 Tax=Pandoravirus dulcis TaxID=1349409 RepID=S4VRU9_9VIRU|nr:hypothetical protein pdul_cds_800 [Pandoravirus dulcis]AGO83002.1 hypothetical protein pdul_cds_800 [Pandoravirus dulcis]